MRVMNGLFFKLVLVLIVGIVLSYFFCMLQVSNQGQRNVTRFSNQQDGASAQKKIMIFTSSGGRGHISATEALTEYCNEQYQVESVYALREILGPVDFIYTITCGRYHSEELYNYFITHNYIWVIPIMVWFGECFFWLRANKISQLIEDYLAIHQPDLIISVIPMINGATLKAAEHLNIPFWVIPTDLDAQKFAYQIDKPTYEKFFFNVAYDDSALKETFASAFIDAEQMTYAGFPVRESFIKAHANKAALKNELNISADKPVVMLLMGGLGSRDTIPFAQELAQIQQPMHVLICIGKSEGLRPELEAMATNPLVTWTIIGFTERIADLMAVSDLLITKSGGLSVNEALYMELPMILDATSSGLIWENFNRIFVERNEYGLVLSHKPLLHMIIESILSNPEVLQKWKYNIQQLNKKNPRIEVLKVIKKLIE